MKLGLRRRTVLVAVGSFAAGLALLLLAFNVVLARRLDSEAQSVLESRAAAQRANIGFADGRVRVREAPGDAALDGAAWVFSGRQLVDPQRIPAGLRATASRLAAAGGRVEADLAGTRLLAEPRRLRDGSTATVVAAVSLAPYTDARTVAVVGYAIIGLVLLGLVAFVANRTVSSALRPVHEMTEQAASWSERDLHRRFELGPVHDELTALAATLDGLLERVDTSFQHERRFSAEVAHELRMPLARQRVEVELALRDESTDPGTRAALEVVLREVDRMTVTIDTLVAAAQAELDPTHGRATSAEIAHGVVELMEDSALSRGVGLAVDAEDVAVHVEPNYAVQTLLPVIDNAVRHARSRVAVSCAPLDGVVVFAIGDDGPGVAEADLERIFEPGVRLDPTDSRSGAGLGLPLARRLARAVGGEVLAVANEAGARFEVRLPVAEGVIGGPRRPSDRA